MLNSGKSLPGGDDDDDDDACETLGGALTTLLTPVNSWRR